LPGQPAGALLRLAPRCTRKLDLDQRASTEFPYS
jgi:hypothetical protein